MLVDQCYREGRPICISCGLCVEQQALHHPRLGPPQLRQRDAVHAKYSPAALKQQCRLCLRDLPFAYITSNSNDTAKTHFPSLAFRAASNSSPSFHSTVFGAWITCQPKSIPNRTRFASPRKSHVASKLSEKLWYRLSLKSFSCAAPHA